MASKELKSNVLGAVVPSGSCADKKCPFHGEVSVKNELLRGKVVKKDINHSATIEWFRPSYISKYERYAMKRSRLRVHNPTCLDASVGAQVVVARTRPLSKTKHHVIIQVLAAGHTAMPATSAPEQSKKPRSHKSTPDEGGLQQ